jgi:hypothetical protein
MLASGNPPGGCCVTSMAIPLLFAYRLGRAYGPDSSATALAGAVAAGGDGLETDAGSFRRSARAGAALWRRCGPAAGFPPRRPGGRRLGRCELFGVEAA